MQTNTIPHEDIRYNATEQQFEARVTLHDATGARVYACAITADLATPLDVAADALHAAALHRHTSSPGLFSTQQSVLPAPLRAPTRAGWRNRLLSALPGLRSWRRAG